MKRDKAANDVVLGDIVKEEGPGDLSRPIN